MRNKRFQVSAEHALRTAEDIARPGRRSATSKGFVYDFASISQVHQAGRRQQDSRKYEPMAWPEYLQWYTEKCPNHQRYSSTNEFNSNVCNVCI